MEIIQRQGSFQNQPCRLTTHFSVSIIILLSNHKVFFSPNISLESGQEFLVQLRALIVGGVTASWLVRLKPESLVNRREAQVNFL